MGWLWDHARIIGLIWCLLIIVFLIFWHGLIKRVRMPDPPEKNTGHMTIPINIIFDGPPSHKAGRFVEVETDDGQGIKVGEWIERDDGYWALRITSLPSE